MAQRTSTPTIDPAHPEPNRIRMTYEEFQDWYTEGRRGEWVDGEVIPFVAPKINHQDIGGFLYALLHLYVEDRGLGKVFQPIEMKLREGRSCREPDLVFVAASKLDRLTRDGLVGPADLVIEIVSDDSVRRDRKEKFDEYEASGVREYWVVDPRPLRQTIYAYVLGDEGIFNPIGTNESREISSIVLPGFWIDPTWLWQNPTPNVAETLRTIEAGR